MDNNFNIELSILNVENEWNKAVIPYIQELFSKVHLPSHGHLHHQRVWKYCKELIFSLSRNDFFLSRDKIEAVYIACFFHDTGLTETLREEHGEASQKICKAFFEKKHYKQPILLSDALEAIMQHEDKSYSINKSDPDSVLSILCTADDVDAFGYIGIYRYAEIYLMRKFTTENMASKVLLNLEKRIQHILLKYNNIEPFATDVFQKASVTKLFYTNLYNKGPFNTADNPEAIIQIIKEEIIKQKNEPLTVWKKYATQFSNGLNKDFCIAIQNELSLT